MDELNEKIEGLVKKAEKSGMPYGILKKVYDRGMAAWRGGHRPGTSQQQWAFARVNSFVTKSSGTWGGADKDLAKKVRAAKKQMSKSYKEFIKEYGMGYNALYMKPMAALNPLRKKENVKKVKERWIKELKKKK